MKKSPLLLFLLLTSPTGLMAQVQGLWSVDLGYSYRTFSEDYSNYPAPVTNEIKSNLFHIHTHGSMLGFLWDDSDRAFRFGDYVGVDSDLGSWENTFTTGSSPKAETKSEFMVSFGLAWGLQASYAVNDLVTVGAKYYFYAETEAGHNADYSNRSLKFFALSGSYGPVYAETAFGSPYDFSDAWKQYGKDSAFKLDVKYVFEGGYNLGVGYSTSTKDKESMYPAGSYLKPKEESVFKQYYVNLGILI